MSFTILIYAVGMLCFAVVTICLTHFVMAISRLANTKSTLEQGKAIRDFIDFSVEKCIKIVEERAKYEERALSVKERNEETEGLLADVIRENGLEPKEYSLSGLVLAKRFELNANGNLKD